MAINQKFYFGLLAGVLGVSIATFIPSVFAKPNLARLTNIYEASGVQVLPDGRILVAEDEPERALSFVKFDKQGDMTTLDNTDLLSAFETPLDDLEGLAMDNQGYLYAITSHSLNKKGKRKANREQLLRFKIDGDKITDITRINNLLSMLDNDKQLQEKYPNIDFYDSDIEGLGFDTKNNTLLLGFKEPLVDGRSMIIGIRNIEELFTQAKTAAFTSPIFLDLQKGGIRAISYSSVLGQFILANEVRNKKGKNRSKLWRWDGKSPMPKEIKLPKMKKYKNIEALGILSIKGKEHVLVMCDDGKEKKGKGAHFFLLALSFLQH